MMMDGWVRERNERERDTNPVQIFAQKHIKKARSHPHRLMDLEVPSHRKEEMHVS
jgi:hypothetical protein